MVNIAVELKRRRMKSRMLLQVHDELVFEAAEAELQDLQSLVKQGMEGVVKFRVPLRVEVGVGANWAEAH